MGKKAGEGKLAPSLSCADQREARGNCFSFNTVEGAEPRH